MSLGVLIVGLGQIGVRYDLHLEPAKYIYSHARAFSRHPVFYLMAGVDSEIQQRKDFERVYACPAYEDIHAALTHHRPEVVVIAVPTKLHGQVLNQILQQCQPKIILCEKPLSYDVKEAERMVKNCAAKGIRLYVNYMRRSDPGVIEIKRRLDADEINKPVKGVCWYSKGFLNNGSHFFNLLEYWLDPMTSSDILDPGRFWNDVDPEPDVRAVFTRGTIIFMALREEAFSHYGIELLSSNGRLLYERGGEKISWQSIEADPCFPGYTVLSVQAEILDSGMDRYQWHVVDQLAKALEGQHSYLCSGDEALTTLKTIQTIIEKR